MRWSRRRPPALILLYHRVATPTRDPQLLSVSPERFAEHLEVVRRCAEPVALAGILAQGEGPRAAITFDDGYADNLHEAAPLLAAAGVPATVFVVSGQVGTTDEFWWDELERVLL